MLSSSISFLIASFLSIHGLVRKSLSPSGAAMAWVVGYLMMLGPLNVFGVLLIAFYLIGSRATNYKYGKIVGKHSKAMLEAGHHEAGYRSPWQVVCNSLAALVACVTWNAIFVRLGLHGRMFGSYFIVREIQYDGMWCPINGDVAGGVSRILMFAALGHFACCLGDTLASELGILSRSHPRLITTFKVVPPGTNGAVSVVGTVASVGGGVSMGSVMAGCLLWENVACRQSWLWLLEECLVWGAVAGLFGSLVDSVMGATIQRTRYAVDEKLVLTDESEVMKGSKVKVISGLDVLTNNQVNLLSSMLTAGLLGYVA